MSDENYEKIDLNKLSFNEKEATTEESLADVEHIKWTADVLNGERKVVISKAADKKNDEFNEFLKVNKEKIDAITPKNPVVKKNDEWNDEIYDLFVENHADEFKRPCSISESIIESCKEIKLMQEGKLPKKSWDDLKEELKKIKDEE